MPFRSNTFVPLKNPVNRQDPDPPKQMPEWAAGKGYDTDLIWDVEDFVQSVRKEVAEKEAEKNSAFNLTGPMLASMNEDLDGDQIMTDAAMPDRNISQHIFNTLPPTPDQVMTNVDTACDNTQQKTSRPSHATTTNTFKPYSNEAKRFNIIQAALISPCLAKDVDICRLTRMTHRLRSKEIERAIENAYVIYKPPIVIPMHADLI